MNLKEYMQNEQNSEQKTMDLRTVGVGESHNVTFRAVREVPNGLLAEVTCETLEGTTLWLRGSYGPQNGLLSLANAAEDPTAQMMTYQKVASDKSPAGYAHRWTVAE
jgi:hypothetical protein